MRSKGKRMEVLFEWLRRDNEGKKRLKEAYKKATPIEQGISFVDKN